MELDRNFKNSNIKFLFDVWLPTLLEPRWYSISRSFTLLKSQTIKAYRCGLKIFRKKKTQLMIEHDLCVFCESEFERRFH